MATYKDPLTQAAIGITRSATLGKELADSFYSTMFGCTGRDGAVTENGGRRSRIIPDADLSRDFCARRWHSVMWILTGARTVRRRFPPAI
jgi:hypothetical protein